MLVPAYTNGTQLKDLYLYVATNSDLHSREEEFWCEPRKNLDGLSSERTPGKAAYRRVTNPRTGLIREQWETHDAYALVHGSLASLGVLPSGGAASTVPPTALAAEQQQQMTRERWHEVCQALAVPGLVSVIEEAFAGTVPVQSISRPPPCV